MFLCRRSVFTISVMAFTTFSRNFSSFVAAWEPWRHRPRDRPWVSSFRQIFTVQRRVRYVRWKRVISSITAYISSSSLTMRVFMPDAQFRLNTMSATVPSTIYPSEAYCWPTNPRLPLHHVRFNTLCSIIVFHQQRWNRYWSVVDRCGRPPDLTGDSVVISTTVDANNTILSLPLNTTFTFFLKGNHQTNIYDIVFI